MLTDPLWPKGKNPTYNAFVVEVGIRRDHKGGVRSYRRLQDADDASVVEDMGPSRGMEEASFGLLTEATRTEAMLQVLAKLSNEPEYLKEIASAESAPEDLIEKISDMVRSQVTLTLDKIVEGLARETVEQVHHGLRHENATG